LKEKTREYDRRLHNKAVLPGQLSGQNCDQHDTKHCDQEQKSKHDVVEYDKNRRHFVYSTRFFVVLIKRMHLQICIQCVCGRRWCGVV